MKQVAITGYNSFIGNYFYKKYKKKYKIIYYKQDINNISKFKLFTKKNNIDFFIHFAGLSRIKCDLNKNLCKKTNFLSIKKIIDHFNNSKIKPNIIFISSSHIYGNTFNKVKENFKKKPKNLYGKLKLKSENYIKKNYEKYCILRLFNTYGKNQPLNFFIPDIKRKVISSKQIKLNKSIRDFIHIDDAVKIIEFIVKTKTNDIINVGSGKGTQLSSVVKIISKKIKKKPIIKLNNRKDKLVADITKLRKIGYKHKINKLNEKNFNF